MNDNEYILRGNTKSSFKFISRLIDLLYDTYKLAK